MECIAGADIPSEHLDESLLLTIVTQTVAIDATGHSGSNVPRLIAFKVNSKDERNQILTGLR